MTEADKNRLHEQARYLVVSNLLADLSARMQEPMFAGRGGF